MQNLDFHIQQHIIIKSFIENSLLQLRTISSHLVFFNSSSELEIQFFLAASTIGVATNVILSWLGSQAAARWNAARDLHAVVSTGAFGDEPVLGANFRPMLLARLPKEGWWEVVKNCGEEFFVETKYDGEHVLMHKISCDSYIWYTRNGKDFTKDYGSTSSQTDLLSGRIHPHFRSSVNDCILDCELMLWDKKLKKLCRRQFKSHNSEHRSHSFRHLDPSDNVQLVVIVFDLLYLNGKSIMNAPLYQRLQALDTAVLKNNQSVNTISIAPRTTISTKEEVESLFQKALSAGEEGIVVKRKDVVYQPGTRMTKNGWFKLKAYLSDNELDVALVGIMPEKGKDGQVAYQLAVRDGEIYRTITTCSAGLSRIDHDYIYNLSSKSDGPLLKQSLAECHCYNFMTKSKLRLIRIKVVEITAAGIRDGKFIDPVMRRIRYDKDVEEVDTIATFREYEQVLTNSKLSNMSPTKQKPRKLTKRMIVEASKFVAKEAKL
uniref:DNA_LIGASE_A3 domain-containing protein n=1 Tax=Angiostrongylus cantonensis TaxID=6313 RepID=A0A158P5Q1_ANGCA